MSLFYTEHAKIAHNSAIYIFYATKQLIKKVGPLPQAHRMSLIDLIVCKP